MSAIDVIDRRIIEVPIKNARTSLRHIAKTLRNEGYDIQGKVTAHRMERLEKRLPTASVSGNWNPSVPTTKDESGKNCELHIIRKLAEYIEDYRDDNLKFRSINAYNVQSVTI